MIDYIMFFQFSLKPIMKRNLTAVIVLALVLCVILGNVPFRAMLVCVHGGGDHGEKAVHLHFDQLPGLPCHESSPGLTPATHEEGPRHFSLALETLTNVQTPFKRSLNLLPPVQVQPPRFTMHSPAGTRSGCPFFDPSFVFFDTAFSKTTILII